MGRFPKITVLLLFLSFGYNLQFSEGFPQSSNSLEENVSDKTASSTPSSVIFNDTDSDKSPVPDSVLIPRQEEDEEDESKQIVQGVGNILTGAFGLDIKKVLKGAFSFADEDVRDNILNVILLGKKPPYSETNPTSPTTTVATTPSTKANGTRRGNDTRIKTASGVRRPFDPYSLVDPFAPAQPTEPPTTPKPPKTTTEENDEDEEFEDN